MNYVVKQNTLSCNKVSDPEVDGASPKYTKASACEVIDVGLPEWYDAAGSALTATTVSGTSVSVSDVLSDVVEDDSFTPCASKGLCDSSTGSCSCFDGHYGEAC